MELQKTIAREVSISGVGVHSGNFANLQFLPAGPNEGITFERVDLPGRPRISARISNVIDLAKRPRRTSIGTDHVEVHTIEHLMASLAGLSIDNITIQLDAAEVPCSDGSAAVFVGLLKDAGIKTQDAPKRYYQVRDPLFLEEDGAAIMLLPGDDFRVSYTLSYDHPLLKAQYLHFSLTNESFEHQIARARTFCLEDEVGELRSQGLGKGADYQNTLVLGASGIIKNSLRFEDEFARHKVLDLIGDLYLLGLPIKGHVIGIRSGHPINLELLNRIERQRRMARGAGVRAPTGPVTGTQLDINDIQKILPHRYPFLLVDKIVTLEEGRRCVGIKNVTVNDNFFIGHFPGRPIMPGVMVIEAMAQVAGILMLSRPESRGKLAYFMSMDRVKFRRPVVPGDQLWMEAEAVKLKAKTGQVHAKALVDGNLACEAEFCYSLADE